ncbi:MAG: hypothetical protein HONBIEJF_01046 [Fimbriimonadaceae bacterium]|nr:hypothetical protein [Fimbriimonadaceae bacterium]
MHCLSALLRSPFRWQAILAVFMLAGAIHASNTITEEDARRAGPGHPWQGEGANVNLYSLAKQTGIQFLHWQSRGSLSCGLGLFHNSQANTGNSTIGPKWQHSYDTHLQVWKQAGIWRAALVWGNHSAQLFQKNQSVWNPSDGYRSMLEDAGNGFRLTLKNQTNLQFDPVPAMNANVVPRRYRLTSLTDPNGNQIQYQYDGLSRLIRADDPSGRALRLNYSQGKLKTVDFTAPGGFVRTWTLSYDGGGRLSKIELPGVQTDSGMQTYAIQYEYDANLNITKVIDCEGNTSLFGYNGNQLAFAQWPGNAPNERALYASAGNLRSVTDPLGNTTRYEYDGLSRLVRREDASFFDIFFEFNDPNYSHGISRVLMPSGTQTRYAYDAAGNVTQATDPAGEMWDYTYDARNNLVRTLAPLVTDAFGNVETGRHRTDYFYDANSNLVRFHVYTNPNSFLTTTFGYNMHGDTELCTNPLGRTWKYEYDTYGNRISATTPLGLTVRRFYDSAALSAGFTVPNAWADATGLRTERILDEWGRLRRTDFLNEADRRYSYDGLGRLVKMMDATGQTDLSYNQRGLLASTVKGPWSVQYGYDANCRTTSMVDTSGGLPHALIYGYDQKSRLVRIEDGADITTYNYDADDRLVMRKLGNGASSTYAYLGGRLTSVMHDDRFGGVIAAYQYLYQEDGGIKRIDGTSAVNRFQYDWLGRLVRENRSAVPAYDHLYAYDAAGNRVMQSLNGSQTGYAYDADNRLVQAFPQGMGVETYTYDPVGHLVQRVRNNNTEIFRFGYSTTGNLTTLEQFNGQVFIPYASYTYDGLDRRVQRHRFIGGVPFQQDQYHIPIELNSLSLVSCQPIRVDSTIQGNPSTEALTWAGGLIRTSDLAGNEKWMGTDGVGDLRSFTNQNGLDSNYRSVFNAFGKAALLQGPATIYGYGTDRGVRSEGDAGLLYAKMYSDATFSPYPSMGLTSGFYDPEIGRPLPSGPNLWDMHQACTRVKRADYCGINGRVFDTAVSDPRFYYRATSQADNTKFGQATVSIGGGGGGGWGYTSSTCNSLNWDYCRAPSGVDAADYVIWRKASGGTFSSELYVQPVFTFSRVTVCQPGAYTLDLCFGIGGGVPIVGDWDSQ